MFSIPSTKSSTDFRYSISFKYGSVRLATKDQCVEPISDKLRQTEFVQDLTFPDKKEYDNINRISAGIERKMTKDSWYFCGDRIVGDEIRLLAKKWATTIVYSAWLEGRQVQTGDNLAYGANRVKLKPMDLNPWAIVGLAYLESRLDICALGLYPRKRAYVWGLIKPRKRSISHTKKEVIRALTDPRMIRWFRTSGFDVGGLQELTRFYPNHSLDFLLSWEGLEAQIHYMANRGRFHKTRRPWRWWPGHDSSKKDYKVVHAARMFGATKEDLR